MRQRVPDRVLRYGLPVVCLAILLATVYCARALGIRFALFYGLLYVLLLIVVLGAAWLGYGPGILLTAISTVVLPHLMRVGSTRPGSGSATVDVSRFALVLIISLLVSRISETRRRTEASLRRTAEELETRVRERTEEALRSAGAAKDAEERLRFVLDAAEIGYWDYDVSSDRTTRSRKYDEIFGYAETPAEWTHATFLKHVHPADLDRVVAGYEKARLGQSSMEFRILRPDQSVHWVWMQAQGHRDGAGNPVHVSGVVMDTTGRRQIADSLREQAQLLDLAYDAILSLDWNGAIKFWNFGAEQMYGWSREEAIGKPARELLQTEYPQPLSQIESRLVATGHWEGELIHTTRSGVRRQVASRWALRRDSQGRPKGYLEINTDITEKRRIEEQLRDTQKLESLGVLAGGVAHDFNNLLTGILGNASLVLDTTPEGHRNREPLDEVTKAAERAADLTRQLLAYAGKGRFVMRTVDLSQLVREIGGLVQASIPKHVEVDLRLTERLAGIDADPGQLQQIVMNLVINGAEAIGPEGGRVTVVTALQPVDEQYIVSMSTAGDLLTPGMYVLLEVHDTGCGIAEEAMAKIFDPFYTTKFAGRGLGLSAVLGIVRSHKGALKVYSQPGTGTTFKVLFPASTNAVGNQPMVAARDLEGEGTVLVVDDEETVRQTARHTLERYGYRTMAAQDGAAAVEIYRRQPEEIQLVLLDLTMPVMNGEDTLREMQQINSKVRVLLTSGYNEVEAIHRFSGKGLAGFIQKPYTATGLAEKVKDVLDERA